MANPDWDSLRAGRLTKAVSGSFEWMRRGEPHRFFFDYEPPHSWRVFVSDDRLDGYSTDGHVTEVMTMGECRMRTESGHGVIPTMVSAMLNPIEAHLPLYALSVKETEIDGRDGFLVNCPVSKDFPQPARLGFDAETGILLEMKIGEEVDNRVRHLEPGFHIEPWECGDAPNAAPHLSVAWIAEDVPGIKTLAHVETYVGDQLAHTRTADPTMKLEAIVDWARELADDVRVRPFGEAEHYSAGRKNPAGLVAYEGLAV